LDGCFLAVLGSHLSRRPPRRHSIAYSYMCTPCLCERGGRGIPGPGGEESFLGIIAEASFSSCLFGLEHDRRPSEQNTSRNVTDVSKESGAVARTYWTQPPIFNKISSHGVCLSSSKPASGETDNPRNRGAPITACPLGFHHKYRHGHTFLVQSAKISCASSILRQRIRIVGAAAPRGIAPRSTAREFAADQNRRLAGRSSPRFLKCLENRINSRARLATAN